MASWLGKKLRQMEESLEALDSSVSSAMKQGTVTISSEVEGKMAEEACSDNWKNIERHRWYYFGASRNTQFSLVHSIPQSR